MAYVIRYTVDVAWVPGGVGLGLNAATASGAILGGSSGAVQGQTQTFFNTSVPGSQNFAAADITNLTNTMSADIAAQMTANITRIQNFASGGG